MEVEFVLDLVVYISLCISVPLNRQRLVAISDDLEADLFR